MISFKYSTRLVVLFRDVVIKFPLERKGFLQAYNEKKIWLKYKDIAPLAEFKWLFLGIVCQKRYKPVQEIPTEEVIKLKELIPEFDFEYCDFYTPKNWGKDGDQYILLDYGNSPYVSSLYKD